MSTPRRFKRYPAYKDSGVEWLGEVPVGWEVLSLKRVASIKYGLGEPPQLLAEGLPFIRATNVTRGRIVDRHLQFVDPADVPWNREPTLRAGDIIVVRSGAYTGDSAIIPAQYDGAIAGYDMVVRGRKCLHAFLAWTLLSRYVLEAQIELASLRAAQPHLNAEELGRVVVLLPSETDQRAIATYLDRETARIDALVAKKQRLIELLHEKRTALITRAVTKGLDPKVPMKDSGVEWLGEVPMGWEVLKTTWIFSIGSGTTPRSEVLEYYGGDTPWITTSELRESVVVSTEKSVTELALREHSSLKIHPRDSLAIAMYGATIGRLGFLGIPATVNQACCVFSNPRGIGMQFWFYWLQMRRPYLISLGYGGGQPNLSQELLRTIRVPTPPLAEQHAIAVHLDHESARIDALVAKVRDAITHLKELRTAVISAAVTGKIDVREDVAGESGSVTMDR